jgi:hypothetical protein
MTVRRYILFVPFMTGKIQIFKCKNKYLGMDIVMRNLDANSERCSCEILRLFCGLSACFRCYNRAPSSSNASYRIMGNCCGSTATVPSSPASAPQVTETTTPAPKLSLLSTETSPVPSPQPPSRTRDRTASKPESTHHSAMSSQGISTRSRTKSAPQRPQSSRSLSPQNTRTRAETLSAPKKSSRSDSRPTSTGECDG